MSWLRIQLSDEEQQIVNEERDSHPCQHVRRKMLVLWLLHHGLTREQAAGIVSLGRATVQRYVAAFREGGLEGLRHWGNTGPVSALEEHRDKILQEFTDKPARSVAEAADRIERLTGLNRQPTQVRLFLKKLGFRFQRVRAVPVPPKKVSTNTSSNRGSFSKES